MISIDIFWVLGTVTQPPQFAFPEIFRVMLQVKMPKAYKILPEFAALPWEHETAYHTAIARSNTEDKTNSTVLC